MSSKANVAIVLGDLTSAQTGGRSWCHLLEASFMGTTHTRVVEEPIIEISKESIEGQAVLGRISIFARKGLYVTWQG
jgi:hypothetical protein